MPAKVIKIDLQNYRMDLLSNAAKVLSEGGLVVFPTETVYGLGANANIPSAVKRLYEVKNSPATRPFTIHLSSVDDVYCHTSTVPRLALRLMKAFWPGPLTIVLPIPRDNGKESWVGLRVPDHVIARDIVKLSKVWVIASSANNANQPPPTDAQTVIRTLGEQVDIIIDAGPSEIGISSTVVKVTEDSKFEVMRQGSITEDNIKRFTYKMVVFVCSGNTCRSPMAMGLFRKMITDRLKTSVSGLEEKGYKIISAGTSAIYNSPASGAAVEIMKEKGVDIKGHLSQPVTLSMLEEADEIYVMTKGHLTTLKEWAPLISERIKLLDPGADVEDPIGSGKEVYKQCAAKIQKALERIIC
ncbi:MAG TPA: L-threonylcarbamoyladenylate synthase [Planctomycetota bacterium]|nr:L-threonylcarbamoyladenylate synthase [Planctomycetota bacterium]